MTISILLAFLSLSVFYVCFMYWKQSWSELPAIIGLMFLSIFGTIMSVKDHRETYKVKVKPSKILARTYPDSSGKDVSVVKFKDLSFIVKNEELVSILKQDKSKVNAYLTQTVKYGVKDDLDVNLIVEK